jgi:hypothetical protein
VALSLAFGHVYGRPTLTSCKGRPAEAVVMYLPISLGTIVVILIVVWLVRGL